MNQHGAADVVQGANNAFGLAILWRGESQPAIEAHSPGPVQLCTHTYINTYMSNKEQLSPMNHWRGNQRQV